VKKSMREEEENKRNEDEMKNKIRMVRREMGEEEDRQVALKLKRKKEMKKMEDDERGDYEDGEGGGAEE
jgi:hypothetical protein